MIPKCSHGCGWNKQLDSYSLLIVSKYFIEKDDFINSICVCKKFKETTEKLRFNPIPITSTKLFPKIQTQYLYNKGDIMLKGIDNYEIWYKVNYGDYLKYKEDNIKCHHIVYSHKNRDRYGDEIPNNVTMLNKTYGLKFGGTRNCIQTIFIPNHVTSITNSCFFCCFNLTNIKLSTNLTTIGDGCFSGCSSLSSINLPSFIQSIENSCFENCINLTSINLPNFVTSIGHNCFYHCATLQSIVLPSSISILEENSFNRCYSLTNIELPSSLISIGDYCFCDCYKLSLLHIPSAVNSIGFGCFEGCFDLSQLVLPQLGDKYYPFEVSPSESEVLKKCGLICRLIYESIEDENNYEDEDYEDDNDFM
ncbi:hypothetical protein QTN25_004558 [Entamoeba marina]